MARNLTSAMQAEVDAKVIAPIFLVSIKLANSTEYMWSGIGTIHWNGQDWQGLGDLGKIEQITETSALEAKGTTLSLSGIPNNLLSDSLTEIRVGRPANIYFGTLNLTTGTVTADPTLIYRGSVDQPTTTVGDEESTITIALENKLNDMQRGRTWRLCSEVQKRLYPDDTGLDFVPQLVNSAWPWG